MDILKELEQIRMIDMREDITYYVYVHTSPEGKKYVGMTRNWKSRWRGKTKAYKFNKELVEDIKKFGWDNFRHDILAETNYGWLARKLEKDLILRYRDRCYNLINFSKKPKFLERNTIRPKISQK